MTRRDEKRETEWVDRVEFRLVVDNKVRIWLRFMCAFCVLVLSCW